MYKQGEGIIWINSGTSHSNLSIGDIVVLVDELAPPTSWKLGKVVGVNSGADGLVRVVTVSCSGAILKFVLIVEATAPTGRESNMLE